MDASPPSHGAFARLVSTPERQLALLVCALGAILYIPFAGNYGMWDPWETHYGEVARQMLDRGDFVSQWWPGSPTDRAEFWSKPVFTFWLMALGMKLFGIEWHPHAPADEMVTSWRPEWGSRLPMVLLGILGAWAIYELGRRLAGKRVGMLSALILLTSSQWALISRQAMTDIPFVVPMTVALALAGLALIPADSEIELPRRTRRFGTREISYPDAPAFRVLCWMAALLVLPQLVLISAQLTLSLHLGAATVRLIGLVPMLPYWAALIGALYWCTRATNNRQLYLFAAYVLCGVASLAKGPAGLAIPAIVMVVYLLVTGRLADVWEKLELPRGLLLYAATAVPWYHAMLIRHGKPFWNEFIGDNYVNRAAGRHGDRGTFEYYLQYIGYGMFPWSGFVAVGSFSVFGIMKGAGTRARLATFATVWALVGWVVVTLVNTKFHHYILPALPGLAILAALAIDELLERPTMLLRAGMLLVGVPVTLLCGRDLAAYPARLIWMFNYDYVNMPGTGRPWPLPTTYGDRYEYGNQLLVLACLVTLATLVVVLLARAKPAVAAPTLPLDNEGPHRSTPPQDAPAVDMRRWLLGLAGVLVLLAVGIVAGPATPHGAAPVIPRWLWLAPVACMLPIAWVFGRTLSETARPAMRGALGVLVLLSAVWTGFVIDKVLVELSPHWAQKHVIGAYYSHRRSPDEKLIAWQLYWRGENFYTKNAIYDNPDINERTAFLGDHNLEKMQKWFAAHRGKRVFFVVERARFESLRGTLPAECKTSLTIVDDTNNKLYLAVAQL